MVHKSSFIFWVQTKSLPKNKLTRTLKSSKNNHKSLKLSNLLKLVPTMCYKPYYFMTTSWINPQNAMDYLTTPISYTCNP